MILSKSKVHPNSDGAPTQRIQGAPEFGSSRSICLTLMLTLLVGLRLAAQISQPARYELPHKGGDHDFLVISMGEKGLALVRDIDKFEDGKKNWEVIFLDSALRESWTATIQIEQRMNILGHDYRDGNIYLIFEEPENAGRRINLTEIIVSDKGVKQHQFKPDVSIRLTHFSVLKNKAVFGGYIVKEPTLLMYDLTNESTKVIPGTFLTRVELMDVRNNSNDTFNAVLAERDSKLNKKLVVRTFDVNGVLLIDDVIAIDEDKTIIEAISSSLVRDELVIMGTWTYHSGKEPAGVFSVLVDPFTEQTVNYYDFAELNHFLDYVKPKKASKIKAKAAWRKSVGKPPEFRAHLYPVKIDENNGGFSLLAEVYDPPVNYSNLRPNSPYYNPYNYYSPYGYSPYGYSNMPYRNYNSPYGYPYGSSYAYSNDTRMLHSSLMFFDTHGKLVSDQALKFPAIKLNSKEQVSDFITLGNRTIMVCKQEKEILAQVNEPDGTATEESKIKPALKNENETVRSESEENGAIRFWYGRYFYVYGYQTIRDNQDKSSRDVFYINKIKVD